MPIRKDALKVLEDRRDNVMLETTKCQDKENEKLVTKVTIEQPKKLGSDNLGYNSSPSLKSENEDEQ